ncbi:IS30 family transposase [Curtobacterium sp. MCSS17_006]|nr:IS30 family transposase [Curtobacterium sp. MCSS17_006]
MFRVYLSLSSPQAVRFLALIAEGRGLKPSARIAGIGKETGYRFLRERYLQLRRAGHDPAAALETVGVTSSRAASWEARLNLDGRHHLRVELSVEDRFWSAFNAGASVDAAAAGAGLGRATGYRLLRRRFDELREGSSVASAAVTLRLSGKRADLLERERRSRLRSDQSAATAALRKALAASARVAELSLTTTRGGRKAVGVEDEYWKLMRQGMSNTDACRLLGMSRRSGTLIRQRAGYRIPPASPIEPASSGRYLALRERLQIADLHRLGLSIRQISVRLGRHPSTISRELRRHRTGSGDYLPHLADDDARRQRARPKPHRLVADAALRRLVQRKLNRFWSPEEISGWLRKTYPTDAARRICHETIYRALLLRDDAGLHKRYTGKLRTGRRVRRTRWNNPIGRGSRIRNMASITERPAEAADKQTAGHWEGDLIVGVGSVSAMATLRERTTHYGIVVNLPNDHTARSVNAAITEAFAAIPKHLKRSLTWDQGVEMAAHEQLTATTGVPVFFADRSSPWQRGANENFNGLLRQYFPKGTNLALHSSSHVTAVMNDLNNRPRKRLDYDTPTQRFNAEKRRITALQLP